MDDEPNRVSRGGSWGNQPSYARVARRLQYAPGGRFYDLGVRLVRMVNPIQQLAELGNER